MLLQHRGDRREPRLEQRKSSENWASLQAQNFEPHPTSLGHEPLPVSVPLLKRNKNGRAQPARHSASSQLRFLAGAGADLHRSRAQRPLFARQKRKICRSPRLTLQSTRAKPTWLPESGTPECNCYERTCHVEAQKLAMQSC